MYCQFRTSPHCLPFIKFNRSILDKTIQAADDALERGSNLPETTTITRKKLLVVMCILLTEMCERLTYYSVAANVSLFGTSKLKYTSAEAADIMNIFSGKLSMFCSVKVLSV